jgi:hypothetical protein
MILSEGHFTLEAQSLWPAELTSHLGAHQLNDILPGIPPSFQWSDQNEPDQKDRYLPHLRTYLQLPRNSEADLLSLDNQKSFLSVSDRRLLFDIKGTTDIAVVHKGYIAARAEEQGILAVIELKKVCNAKSTRQIIGQLIAADLISTFSPVAVLTDLCDEWHFYWLEGRTIKHLRPPSRRDAFLFLRLIIVSGSLVGAELASVNAIINELPVSVGKRRKLSPVKEERSYFNSTSQPNTIQTDSDSDIEEEDRQMILYRQVRKMVRNTPFLRDICQPSLLTPMAVEVRKMFG